MLLFGFTLIPIIHTYVQSYEHIDWRPYIRSKWFGTMPNRKYKSPLEPNDHPELDTFEFLDKEGIQIYQSLVGAMQWAISIGRFDVQTAVMTLSSFRAQPRKGHLERVKRVYGHLSNFNYFKLWFRTNKPDLAGFDHKTKFDWSNTVYGDTFKELSINHRLIIIIIIIDQVHYTVPSLLHQSLSLT